MRWRKKRIGIVNASDGVCRQWIFRGQSNIRSGRGRGPLRTTLGKHQESLEREIHPPRHRYPRHHL